jgi:hypothetical protein
MTVYLAFLCQEYRIYTVYTYRCMVLADPIHLTLFQRGNATNTTHCKARLCGCHAHLLQQMHYLVRHLYTQGAAYFCVNIKDQAIFIR